jgi:hypothetical protein
MLTFRVINYTYKCLVNYYCNPEAQLLTCHVTSYALSVSFVIIEK